MGNIIAIVVKTVLGTGNDIVRNRLLNKHTKDAILLLVAVLTSLGYIDKDGANFIITLLSGKDITYYEIWKLALNIAGLFLVGVACYWIWKKVDNSTKK